MKRTINDIVLKVSFCYSMSDWFGEGREAFICILQTKLQIINKHWHILHIDSSFKEIFNNLQLMIVFRKKTSLKQFIGTNTVRNNQKCIAPTQTTTTG